MMTKRYALRYFATTIGAEGWVRENTVGPCSVLVQMPKKVKGRLTLVMHCVTFTHGRMEISPLEGK